LPLVQLARKYPRKSRLRMNSTMTVLPLKGKVAVVTGGSRGIGAAICKRLARDGADIAICCSSNVTVAEIVASAIAAGGGSASVFAADLADASAVSTLFARLGAHYGKLDILVNNAGVAEFLPLSAGGTEHFDQIFSVNVRGLYLCTQHAVRLMPEGGRVINISSGAARAGGANASVYAASKAAVEAMTACLATELGPDGITVNCISPGITRTDMLAQAVPADIQAMLEKQTPLGRVGEPEDIADVAAFLASSDARWVTGQTIAASGGLR